MEFWSDGNFSLKKQGAMEVTRFGMEKYSS